MPKSILFAAGDPGGANAVRPVLLALAEQHVDVAVLNHGPLVQGLPSHIPLVDHFDHATAVCLGTSLRDTIPLMLARAAQARGGKVVAVLDNWVNYLSRLATDGLPPLIPDVYAVMDAKARDESMAEGLPAKCLVVTGHPNLASLTTDLHQADRVALRQSLGLGLSGRELVVFVNEPVSADQGTGPDNPLWRGYTEEDALSALAAGIADKAVDLAIIPHPRDDVDRVKDLWSRVRGHCSGNVVTGVKGRDLVIAADRVAGMASILLYESWLLGKPTLSLQPGLVREDLLSIASRPGIHLLRDPATNPIATWLAQRQGTPQPDLALHAGAAERIAALLI